MACWCAGHVRREDAGRSESQQGGRPSERKRRRDDSDGPFGQVGTIDRDLNMEEQRNGARGNGSAAAIAAAAPPPSKRSQSAEKLLLQMRARENECRVPSTVPYGLSATDRESVVEFVQEVNPTETHFLSKLLGDWTVSLAALRQDLMRRSAVAPRRELRCSTIATTSRNFELCVFSPQHVFVGHKELSCPAVYWVTAAPVPVRRRYAMNLDFRRSPPASLSHTSTSASAPPRQPTPLSLPLFPHLALLQRLVPVLESHCLCCLGTTFPTSIWPGRRIRGSSLPALLHLPHPAELWHLFNPRRYASKVHDMSRDDIEVTALICIHIATKFMETKVLHLSELGNVSEHGHTKDKLKETELKVLEEVDWHLQLSTPHAFLQQLVCFLDLDDADSNRSTATRDADAAAITDADVDVAEKFDVSAATNEHAKATVLAGGSSKAIESSIAAGSSSTGGSRNQSLGPLQVPFAASVQSVYKRAELLIDLSYYNFQLLAFEPLVVAAGALLCGWQQLQDLEAEERNGWRLAIICERELAELSRCKQLLCDHFDSISSQWPKEQSLAAGTHEESAGSASRPRHTSPNTVITANFGTEAPAAAVLPPESSSFKVVPINDPTN